MLACKHLFRLITVKFLGKAYVFVLVNTIEGSVFLLDGFRVICKRRMLCRNTVASFVPSSLVDNTI